jgi:GAF domain-containing protein
VRKKIKPRCCENRFNTATDKKEPAYGTYSDYGRRSTHTRLYQAYSDQRRARGKKRSRCAGFYVGFDVFWDNGVTVQNFVSLRGHILQVTEPATVPENTQMSKYKDDVCSRTTVLRKIEAERDLYAREFASLTARFEEKVRELSVVRRVGETLKHVRDIQRVFGFILEIILEETHAETCSIMLYDRQTETLSVRAAKSQKKWSFDFYDAENTSGVRMSAGEGIAGRVVQEQKAVYIPDIANDKRYIAATEYASEGSMLCLPLEINNKIEGVVNLRHPKPRAFGDEDLRLISILIDQVAIALNSVTAMESLAQLNDTLESKVARATRHLQEANGQLHQEIIEHERTEDALKEAIEEAESANHAKSEFLANMSHEIRTPLNAVIGMVQILDEARLDDEQKDQFAIIKNSADVLLELINRVLDFSKSKLGNFNCRYRMSTFRTYATMSVRFLC